MSSKEGEIKGWDKTDWGRPVPVVVDQGLITSRKPDDLDQFCAKVIEEVAEGRHTHRSAA